MGRWQWLEVTDAGKLRGSITRGDLAACMLEVLGDDSTVGKAFGVNS